MKILKLGCYVAGVLLLLSSCDSLFEKPYDIDAADHSSRIAATALISPIDSVPRIFISQTLPPSGNTPYEPLDNCFVKLYKDDILYDEFVFDSIQKYYLGGKQFNEQDGLFKLEISTPNLPSIQGMQQAPRPVSDFSTTLNIGGGPLSSISGPTDELLISFQDDPNVENFYELIVFPLYSYSPFQNGEQFYPETINDDLIKLDGGRFIFSDIGQNGNQIVISLYDFFYSATDILELRIYLSSITKDKFLYEKTYQKYLDNEGSLFSEPIIIHSNIDNGEGIFSIETTTIDTIRF